ncbi:MAG: sugar transferase [Bacteroidales bacterium]|nr:MAG: sugar transferase [Bacteroidales bacterium]
MNKKPQLAKYLISDYLAALLSWTCFYIFRKAYIEPLKFGYKIPITIDERFYLGLLIIPIFWLVLYYSSGYYRNVFRKSRLSELWHTILNCFFGVIVLFFALILDDTIQSYSNYYLSFIALFSFHFILTYIPRLVITTSTTHKIHNRIIGFNTIIIGSNQQAVDTYLEIENQSRSSGNKIIGFVNVNDKPRYLLEKYLPHLGMLEELKNVIDKYKVEEVIIAIDSSEHDRIGRIINMLIDSNVIIKAIPSMYDILTGKVRMNTIFGTPLIQISHQLMPAWQENLKHLIDIVISLLALIVLTPFCIFLIAGIKLTSRGPVFYSHERIGRYGKPFTIFKFRSMYVGAEKNGPELSSKSDDRVTKFGRFMRKHRLDEIPNFFNVLKGEMSLVGPRPERKYFKDRIINKAPHYIHLLKVRPGITSWGQVKFGYAENVEEMIKRLKYDLIYIDNMSLYVDFKIIIYTLITIIRGRGK